MSELRPESRISVNYIVIHELVKEQTKTEVDVCLSNRILDIGKQETSLLEILNSRYSSSKENIRHGKFSDDENENFPKEFRKYMDHLCEENFLEMTKVTLQNLGGQVKNIPAAKGGYFVFADYEYHSQSYFAVFLIRNTEGKFIKKDATNSYQIVTNEHLDLEKVAMGCRINKEHYVNKKGRYLSFTRKNQDFSDYFINWVAAEELVNNATYTQALIQICNQMPLKDSNGEEIMKRDEFKKKVYGAVNASPNSVLRLATLEELFFQGEGKISQFAQEHNIEIDTEFKPDKKLMRRFVQISAHEDNIRLEFNYDDLNSKITVNGDIITIRSQRLADSIREQQ
jgi:nucleoid-associated protein